MKNRRNKKKKRKIIRNFDDEMKVKEKLPSLKSNREK